MKKLFLFILFPLMFLSAQVSTGSSVKLGCKGMSKAVVTSSVVVDTAGFYALITDGNTVGRYTMFYLTKNGNNKVTSWTDTSGSNNPLSQADTSLSPTWSSDGVTFDGVNDGMKRTSGFTWVQPEEIFAVIKQVSWTANDRIWDGYPDQSMAILQHESSPYIKIYTNSGLTATLTTFSTGTFGLITMIDSGAHSSLRLNAASPVTGSITTVAGQNAGGFSLGMEGGGGGGWSNIVVKEIILRKVVDSSGNQTIIRNYLNWKCTL